MTKEFRSPKASSFEGNVAFGLRNSFVICHPLFVIRPVHGFQACGKRMELPRITRGVCPKAFQVFTPLFNWGELVELWRSSALKERIEMNACLQTESNRMCQLGVFLAAIMIGPSAAAQVSPVPGDAPTLDSSQFHHRFYGAPGASYVVEASSDLTRWTAGATNTVPSSGRLDFADSLAGNFPQRLYRIVPAGGPVGVHTAGG